ncbi:hypothetical protein Acr_00g0050780 [Actinidia rufa]|uniref:Retrotransposon gag domain-containing protein n=1 Tax=Actinidia rufa TaxID=165716 RepID=A0A7J0DLA1_9ERIC|nr:hypothetical protein Acr_00g0050780 [Actinidia rufa]
MHLRSRLLFRPSTGSPLDNRARPMANTSQTLDLEDLHHETYNMVEQIRIINKNNVRLIQHLTTNPPPLAAPPSQEVQRPRRSNRSGSEESQSHHSTSRARRWRTPCPRPRREMSSSSSTESQSSSETPEVEGEKIKDLDARIDAINTGSSALKVRRSGRSPCWDNQMPRHRDESTTQKIKDLDARIDTINTGSSALITVDSLIKTDPMDHLDSYKSLMLLKGYSDEVMCKAFSATLKGSTRSWFRKLLPRTIDSFGDLNKLFVANFMSFRVRQKNVSHIFTIHQKETKSLKDYIKRFNQAVLEVEYPSDKIVIMAMMEGLHPGPLFDSLSKNVPSTLLALQSKADKYITAKELAEAKRRRRGKDDHKRNDSPRHMMRSTH